MGSPQCRQRPRSNRYETIGMLSRGAIGVPHPMHAEPGLDTDCRSGTRAATTFTKLPNASAGVKTRAARATFIRTLSAAEGRLLSASGLSLQIRSRRADTPKEGIRREIRARKR